MVHMWRVSHACMGHWFLRNRYFYFALVCQILSWIENSTCLSGVLAFNDPFYCSILLLNIYLKSCFDIIDKDFKNLRSCRRVYHPKVWRCCRVYNVRHTCWSPGFMISWASVLSLWTSNHTCVNKLPLTVGRLRRYLPLVHLYWL